MRVHEVTFDGPRRHELRSVRVRWHDDGSVEIVLTSGRGKIDVIVDRAGTDNERRAYFWVRRRDREASDDSSKAHI